MNPTSLAFLETVEESARKTLPAPPYEGAEWRFQRFLAFHNKSGSLQAAIQAAGREPELVGVIHIREVRDETGAFLRGWLQTEAMSQPEPFVIHLDAGADIDGSTRAVVHGWTDELLRALQPVRRAIEPPSAEAPGRLNSGEAPDLP